MCLACEIDGATERHLGPPPPCPDHLYQRNQSLICAACDEIDTRHRNRSLEATERRKAKRDLEKELAREERAEKKREQERMREERKAERERRRVESDEAERRRAERKTVDTKRYLTRLDGPSRVQSFRMTESMLDELRELAENRATSMNELVRRAVEDYLFVP